MALNQSTSLPELCTAIKSSKSSNGNADPDGIHSKMIKCTGPTFKLFYIHLFNNVSKSNASPWKYGKVIILNKSGKDPTSINAFRPITLTSVVVIYLKEFLSLVKENMLRTTVFCVFHNMLSVKGIHAKLICNSSIGSSSQT